MKDVPPSFTHPEGYNQHLHNKEQISERKGKQVYFIKIEYNIKVFRNEDPKIQAKSTLPLQCEEWAGWRSVIGQKRTDGW